MARLPNLILAAAGLGLALTPSAAEPPPTLAQARAGLWEIGRLPATRAPARECIGNLGVLAQYEHRHHGCMQQIISSQSSSTVIQYSCSDGDFGRSKIDVITPRSLRIETQGISNGSPFNYVLQARRIDDCPKSASVTRH